MGSWILRVQPRSQAGRCAGFRREFLFRFYPRRGVVFLVLQPLRAIGDEKREITVSRHALSRGSGLAVKH